MGLARGRTRFRVDFLKRLLRRRLLNGAELPPRNPACHRADTRHMTHYARSYRRLHPLVDLAIYVSPCGAVEAWLEIVGGARRRLRAVRA